MSRPLYYLRLGVQYLQCFYAIATHHPDARPYN